MHAFIFYTTVVGVNHQLKILTLFRFFISFCLQTGLRSEVVDLDSSLTALLQESEELTLASAEHEEELEGDMEEEQAEDEESEVEAEEELAIEQAEESEWAKQQEMLGQDNEDVRLVALLRLLCKRGEEREGTIY